MRVLEKCRKKNWFNNETKKGIEAYYLELNENELTEKLKLLLTGQEIQRKHQLEIYGKLYIIIDKNLGNAFYVPHGGAHWSASGHWDMSDMFIGMYGIEIQSLNDLINIKERMLKSSIEYLQNDNGVFGNINEFRFGVNSHECFSSAIAESYIYNYFLNRKQYPVIPEEEMTYGFIVNGNRILIKTNAFKIENKDYDWYENSCWKKLREIDKEEWDILYYVPIKWDGKKYNLQDKYKLTYNEFHKNKIFVDNIRNNNQWFIPVDFSDYFDWINEYKINE